MRDSPGEFVRRRPVLFVPGDAPAQIASAGRSGPAALVPALEDAPAPGGKDEGSPRLGPPVTDPTRAADTF